MIVFVDLLQVGISALACMFWWLLRALEPGTGRCHLSPAIRHPCHPPPSHSGVV
jgi:hypothetical protein